MKPSCVCFTLVLIARPVVSCDDILATDAWVREPPPVAKVAAGYLRLENTGDHPVAINRIESDCCTRIALHETTLDGDRVRMTRTEALELAPLEAAVLTPGGAHLMLIAPIEPIRHGDVVPIEFSCAGGGTFRVDFDVMKNR